MDKNKIGLALGSFFAVFHLVWAILVAVIPNVLQTFFDWIFNLHGIEPILVITTMTLMNAIALVLVAFIFGYLLGWIFAGIFSQCDCCSTTKKKK